MKPIQCILILASFVGLMSVGLPAPAAKASSSASPAPMPELLKDAFKNSETDEERWAYTLTTSGNVSFGKPSADTPKVTTNVVRFDPSKPYPEQYTPIQIDGRAPTPKEIEEHRQKGIKRGDQVEKAIADRDKAEAAVAKEVEKNAKLGKPTETTTKDSFDADSIKVVEETPDFVTYSIKSKDVHLAFNGVSPKDIDFILRVGKLSRTIERMTFRIASPFRIKLIVKVNSGEFVADFSKPDPKFGPVMSNLQITGDFSAFFKKGRLEINNVRSDIQRVQPFNERAQVIVGPLKVLGM